MLTDRKSLEGKIPASSSNEFMSKTFLSKSRLFFEVRILQACIVVELSELTCTLIPITVLNLK